MVKAPLLALSFLLVPLGPAAAEGAELTQEQADAFSAHMRAGLADLGVPDHKAALAEFTAALAIKPDSYSAFARRGVTYAFMRNDEQAVADFTHSIAINPTQAGVYYDRALAERKLHQPGPMHDDLEAALRLSPNDLQMQAAVYAMEDRHEDALRVANQRIAAQPNDGWAYASRCTELAFLGRYGEALSDCDQAVRLTPKATNILAYRGAVLLKAGRPADAAADFGRALDLASNNAAARYGRGLAEIQLGKADAGQADIAEARRQNPEVEDSLAILKGP